MPQSSNSKPTRMVLTNHHKRSQRWQAPQMVEWVRNWRTFWKICRIISCRSTPCGVRKATCIVHLYSSPWGRIRLIRSHWRREAAWSMGTMHMVYQLWSHTHPCTSTLVPSIERNIKQRRIHCQASTRQSLVSRQMRASLSSSQSNLVTVDSPRRNNQDQPTGVPSRARSAMEAHRLGKS